MLKSILYRMKIPKSLFNPKSMLSSMVLIFLILILIPVVVIGFIGVRNSSNALIEKTEYSITQSTSQASRSFDLIINRAEDVLAQTVLDETIKKGTLAMVLESPEYFQPYNEARTRFSAINLSNKFIANAYMLFSETKYFMYGDTSTINEGEMRNSDWYKQIVKASGGPVWLNDRTQGFNNISSEEYISVGRWVRNVMRTREDNLNIAIIDISYNTFSDIISDISIGENDETYLIMPSGQVISKTGRHGAGKLDQTFTHVIEKSKGSNQGLFEMQVNDETIIVAFTKSKNNGWISTTVIPKSEVVSAAYKIRNEVFIFGIIFAFLAILSGTAYSINITNRINKIMNTMKKASEGDLTVSLNSKNEDEVGLLTNSFNSMVNQIKQLIIRSQKMAIELSASTDKISSITKETESTSRHVSNAIDLVASGAASQATDTDSSLVLAQELSQKIDSVVSGNKIIEEASKSVKDLTEDGMNAVYLLNNKASEANKITLKVLDGIEILDKNINDIKKIMSIINTIVNQTALLSLNASIEAAKAGEAGKGFSVVAGEVRKLAVQSRNATKEIQDLITNILNQTQNSKNLASKAEIAIKEQSEAVDKSARIFLDITSATSVLIDNITKISDYVKDMDMHKNGVVERIESISAISEETAASTEEILSSTQEQLISISELKQFSEQLNKLSKDLKNALDLFKV